MTTERQELEKGSIALQPLGEMERIGRNPRIHYLLLGVGVILLMVGLISLLMK